MEVVDVVKLEKSSFVEIMEVIDIGIICFETEDVDCSILTVLTPWCYLLWDWKSWFLR